MDYHSQQWRHPESFSSVFILAPVVSLAERGERTLTSAPLAPGLESEPDYSSPHTFPGTPGRGLTPIWHFRLGMRQRKPEEHYAPNRERRQPPRHPHHFLPLSTEREALSSPSLAVNSSVCRHRVLPLKAPFLPFLFSLSPFFPL